ncbi:hypothetical protein SAMN05428971_4350 [Candidatus Pantoea varia]|uniref:Uncharacterized protein n=1 Tax=Candidatus Pantoea varia TaxID=1881036 RepID=A0A1I5HX80_9GAMM|nr:hypothetical protein SAMN05428971_4350 [Pantoea varia]
MIKLAKTSALPAYYTRREKMSDKRQTAYTVKYSFLNSLIIMAANILSDNVGFLYLRSAKCFTVII